MSTMCVRCLRFRDAVDSGERTAGSRASATAAGARLATPVSLADGGGGRTGGICGRAMALARAGRGLGKTGGPREGATA
jgi:hypothetical protein